MCKKKIFNISLALLATVFLMMAIILAAILIYTLIDTGYFCLSFILFLCIVSIRDLIVCVRNCIKDIKNKKE